MKKAELVAQLEGAKALTSVVSIDNVIALIQQLEAEQVAKTESRMTAKLFTRVVDIVEESLNNMRTSEAVDLSSAEFELDWNNCINLTDISLDTDYIYNEIREGLEFGIEIVDEEEAIETQIEAESIKFEDEHGGMRNCGDTEE